MLVALSMVINIVLAAFQVQDGMVRFARYTGIISAVIKGLLLIVIVLWMAAIIIKAADCSLPYVFTGLLVLSVVVLGAFFVCLLALLKIAQQNAKHGHWKSNANETLSDGAYQSI